MEQALSLLQRRAQLRLLMPFMVGRFSTSTAGDARCADFGLLLLGKTIRPGDRFGDGFVFGLWPESGNSSTLRPNLREGLEAG